MYYSVKFAIFVDPKFLLIANNLAFEWSQLQINKLVFTSDIEKKVNLRVFQLIWQPHKIGTIAYLA